MDLNMKSGILAAAISDIESRKFAKISVDFSTFISLYATHSKLIGTSSGSNNQNSASLWIPTVAGTWIEV
jgi:hypothetical protein